MVRGAGVVVVESHVKQTVVRFFVVVVLEGFHRSCRTIAPSWDHYVSSVVVSLLAAR